jgi:Tfp pilus assembly protein PilX
MVALILAAAPAIPNDVGGKYVAGAYIVFVLMLLIYVAIMGMKLARIERDLRDVAELAEARRDEAAARETAPAEVKS